MLNSRDSVFVDSPLSKLGADQANRLREFIQSNDDELGELLRGTEGDSIICSSNLRRSLSTCTIGLWDRLQRTGEKIHVLSALQEITFNVDGVSIAPPHHAPPLSNTELGALYESGDTSQFKPNEVYNCDDNNGDKDVKSEGINRLEEFCEWCFQQQVETIVAGGHSLYFRFFLKTFLAQASKHEGKLHKISNCGTVAMTLRKGTKNGKVWYEIDEDSIRPMYEGFEKKQSKKKKKKLA